MLYIKKFIKLIKNLNEIMDVSFKKRGFFVLLLIVVSSLMETLGISIILPFVAAVINTDNFKNKPIVKSILSFLNLRLTNLQFILLLSLAIVIMYIIKNLFLMFSDYQCLKYENDAQKMYSFRMLKSYVFKSYEDNVNTNSSEVLRAIGNDATSLYYIIQSIFKILSNTLTILLIGFILFFTDALMAAFVVLLSGLISLLIIKLLKNQIKSAGKDFNESMMMQQKVALQILNGYKELTILNRKDPFISYYDDVVESQRKAQLKYRFLQAMPIRVLEVVVIISIILSIDFRLKFGINFDSFIPKLSVFAVACIRLLPLLNQIAASNTTIIYYMPSFNNAYKNLKDYSEPINSLNLSNPKELSFNNIIELKNISWRYQGSDKYLFNNISLDIKKGDIVGIVGKSGVGKTTLVDIFLGLLKPKSGGVFVDGVNISNNLLSWSKLIGYVPQNIYLLDDTIRNNILFGLEPDSDTDNKIFESLQKASLYNFVNSLKDKDNTIVGEYGAKLSGGQRQRIVIARALYYKPQIIVFDEATSALDERTEKEIIDTINNIKNNVTIIIITHRMSSLAICNKIFELKDNSIKLINRI